MADQQNPSPEVADVIDSLPQASGETQGTRKRTYTKRRRKRTAKRSAAAREASSLNIPSSDEEPRSRVFLTAVANLALLVAVLTIVFAAHRVVQNNRQQTAEQTIDQTAQTTEQTSEPQTTAEQTIDNRPRTIDQQQQATEQTIDNRPKSIDQQQQATEQTIDNRPKTIDQQQLTQPTKPVNRFSSDPYTNGGPLDLDRREDIGGKGLSSKGDSPPQKRGLSPLDHKNPWNSGGSLDLDSETSRQQYKKALSLAE